MLQEEVLVQDSTTAAAAAAVVVAVEHGCVSELAQTTLVAVVDVPGESRSLFAHAPPETLPPDRHTGADPAAGFLLTGQGSSARPCPVEALRSQGSAGTRPLQRDVRRGSSVQIWGVGIVRQSRSQNGPTIQLRIWMHGAGGEVRPASAGAARAGETEAASEQKRARAAAGQDGAGGPDRLSTTGGRAHPGPALAAPAGATRSWASVGPWARSRWTTGGAV